MDKRCSAADLHILLVLWIIATSVYISICSCSFHSAANRLQTNITPRTFGVTSAPERDRLFVPAEHSTKHKIEHPQWVGVISLTLCNHRHQSCISSAWSLPLVPFKCSCSALLKELGTLQHRQPHQILTWWPLPKASLISSNHLSCVFLRLLTYKSNLDSFAVKFASFAVSMLSIYPWLSPRMTIVTMASAGSRHTQFYIPDQRVFWR